MTLTAVLTCFQYSVNRSKGLRDGERGSSRLEHKLKNQEEVLNSERTGGPWGVCVCVCEMIQCFKQRPA